MVGSTFERCCLTNSNFELSYLQDTSFEYSNCKGCVFRLVEGNIASIMEGIPSYHGISFKGADLRDCDFRRAHMKGVDFSGADLTGSRFLRSFKVNLNEDDLVNESASWYIGDVYNINYKGKNSDIQIIMTFGKELDKIPDYEPRMYKFDKKEGFVELNQQTVEGNQVTAKFTGNGAYVLMKNISLE